MPARPIALLGTAALLGVAGLAVPAAAAPKVTTVKLNGITFLGKPSAKLTARVGDTLRFVWAGGAHDVRISKSPAGFKRVQATTVVAKRAPLPVKLTKKGTYAFFCTPHRIVGMTLTVTVK